MNSVEEHLVTSRKRGISLKSALIEWAAFRRDLTVSRLTGDIIVVRFPSVGPVGFHNMNGPHSSVAGKWICDNKQYARILLEDAGLAVARSRVFDYGDLKAAIGWLESTLSYPVAVKPTNAAQGRGVSANVQTAHQLKTAWRNTFFKGRPTAERLLLYGIELACRLGIAPKGTPRLPDVLVEKHCEGVDFRAFVVREKVISMTQRRRANVVGDGRSSIRGLIQKKNQLRAKNPYLKDYPIPLNPKHLDVLISNHLSLSSVPEKDELVVLRSVSNLSAGGDSIDFTEEAHPQFHKLAVRAVKAIPGMEYAGVDIITHDITQAPDSDNYVIGEVEYSPAPLSHFPFIGSERDMAGAILDYYLGEKAFKQ